MIRTLAVLAGGFLGFAAALMVANSSALDAVDVAAYGEQTGYSSGGQAYAEFEGELGLPAKQVPLEAFDDAWLNDEAGQPSGMTASATINDTKTQSVDRTSDIYRLQFELARLDCFDGQLNGKWSLAFHESLASLALVRELDFKALGSVEAVIGTLRSYSAGACGKVQVAAVGATAVDVRPNWPELLELPAVNVRRKTWDVAAVAPKRQDPVAMSAMRIVQPVHVHHDLNSREVKSKDISVIEPAARDGKEVVLVLDDFSANVVVQTTDRVADEASDRNRRFVFPELVGRHSDKFTEVTQQVAEAATAEIEERSGPLPIDHTSLEKPLSGSIVTVASDRVVRSGELVETSQYDTRVAGVMQRILATEPDVFDLPEPVQANEPQPVRQAVALPSQGVERPWSSDAAPDIAVTPHAVRGNALRHDLSDGFPEQFPVLTKSENKGQVSKTHTAMGVPLPARRMDALRHVYGVSALPEKNRAKTITETRTRTQRRAVRVARKRARVKATATAAKKSKAKKVVKQAWKHNRKAIFESRD